MLNDNSENLDTTVKKESVDTLANPVKVEDGHHGQTDTPAQPLEPQVINGVKVYPTSYIPVRAVLHYPKKSLISMELEHIEGIHIAVFFGILFFLFIGMWKRAGLR